MHLEGQHAVQLDALPSDSPISLEGGGEVEAPVASSLMPVVPAFSSRPGASDKLVIDFDGDFSGSWGGFSPGQTPAYNTEGDESTFTAGELANIEYIWQRVAEKFSPFNIDVTTVDTGNLSNGVTLRAIVGGSGSWYGSGVGGVAYVDGYTNGLPNTVYIFSNNYGSAGGVAETVAHESGHAYGLYHQSVWSNGVNVQEYNPGTSAKAPIMGSSGSSQRGMWWLGPNSNSPSATAQDDLAIISRTGNTFGYRVDDVGNTIAAATAMSANGNTRSGSGVITQISDVDVFSFNVAAAGPTNVRIDIAGSLLGPVGMLDSVLEIQNSSGQVVATASTAALGESLTFAAQVGTYYAFVKSQGNYGDVGQYTVTATSNPDTIAPTASNGTFAFQTGHTVQFTFSEDVSNSLIGEDVIVQAANGGATYTPSNVNFNPVNSTAFFNFAQPLPDGNYTATLPAGSVTDLFGNVMNTPTSFNFYVFAGDGNRDRIVNVADFASLSANFNNTPRVFSQGDYNYDNKVDISDFALLASRFNTTLPAAGSLPRAVSGFSSQMIENERVMDELMI